MGYEVFARICVGALVKPEAATALHAEFLASLGLDPASATASDVFERLRLDTPKHKLHEPDRLRYERALEGFIDERWSVDFALGGVSPDGVFEPRRGFLFVGVRVDGFEHEVSEIPRHAAAPEKPQWLRKGDMSAGSELHKIIGPDARKALEHAARTFVRAGGEVMKDAVARLKPLPISKQHEIGWALCRWLVDSQHESVLPRGGRLR